MNTTVAPNTKTEAVKTWIERFDDMPLEILATYYYDCEEDLVELTTLQPKEEVCVKGRSKYGKVIEVSEGTASIQFSDNQAVLAISKLKRVRSSELPAYGTGKIVSLPMHKDFIFSHLKDVSDIGIRIFHDKKLDMLLLLPSNNKYAFAENWIPLYEVFEMDLHNHMNSPKTAKEKADDWCKSFNRFSWNFINTLYTDLFFDEETNIVKGSKISVKELNGVFEVLETSDTSYTISVDGSKKKISPSDAVLYNENFNTHNQYIWTFPTLEDENWALANQFELCELGLRLYNDSANNLLYFSFDDFGSESLNYEFIWKPIQLLRGKISE